MSPEQRKLIDTVSAYASSADIELVKKAYQFAFTAHADQRRLSGDPYITHPVAAAQILADMKLGGTIIAAALLHDTLEDTSTTLAQLDKQFGRDVSTLVNGVTKLGDLDMTGDHETKTVENFRKLFLAMARSTPVVFIKLADRLHNMRTLSALPEQRRRLVARETQEIFVPLANRLGMGQIKGELADLAFRHLDPDNYKKLKHHIEVASKERERAVIKMKRWVSDQLNVVGIDSAEIEGRAKHISSLSQKLEREQLSNITDLVALRIIVLSVEECYQILGIIHQHFKPLPGKIKDYIAVPKPNGYRSLHTTVFGIDGQITEIQIRTRVMHEEAERGAAAHWLYDEGKGPEQKIAWVKSLLDWQKQLDGAQLKEALQLDFLNNRIFVFSPKGDVYDLPLGATPVDFAYMVHSDVGARTTGAKVNGQIVTLDHELENGNVVEILTTKQAKGPSRDWLKSVKTSHARGAIRSWHNEHESR